MQGTNRSGEEEEKALLCDPGSELRLQIGGREKRRAKKINDMEKKMDGWVDGWVDGWLY